MFEHLLSFFANLEFLSTLLTFALGFVYLWLWARRGFWVPWYVHVLAFAALLLGLALLLAVVSQGDFDHPLLGVFLVLFLPAIVYLLFVFLGGVAATDRRQTKSREKAEHS